MLRYRAYLIESLTVVGIHSDGYLLISEPELDSLLEGNSIVRELSNGVTTNIRYRDLKIVVRDI